MSQPILRFIEGIDKEPRELTASEVYELTRDGSGDWFAQYLATTPVDQRDLSLRAVLTKALPAGSHYEIFGVADGLPVVYDHENPNNPLNSVSRGLRFVIIALPDSQTQNLGRAIIDRTLCFVASPNPDGTGAGAFLQCASWDPRGYPGGRGITRFYQRSRGGGWVYFGDSFNAFVAASSGHGPFDGHVGGSLIMKELTLPWTHWFGAGNVNQFVASLGSRPGQPSLADPHNVLYDPLFSNRGAPFSLLSRAEALEPVIRAAVQRWYDTRFLANFVDSSFNAVPTINASIIQSWVGHLLDSKATNIAASPTSEAQVSQQAAVGVFPITLFLNINALQVLLPRIGVQWGFTVQNEVYVDAVNKLQLSLYYDDRSTDPPTRKLAVPGTEGPFAFPTIEPGVEGFIGVAVLNNESYRSVAQLLTPKAMAAMLMVDFFNPMYSTKRKALLQYLPEHATLDTATRTYDVLPQFVATVQASPNANVEGTGEHEILKLLATPDDTWINVFTSRVNGYLAAVNDRLTGTNGAAAVQDYMVLAEGRRRLYKGWQQAQPNGVGLDEFRLTLPIAAQPDPFPLTEMTERGEIVALREVPYALAHWHDHEQGGDEAKAVALHVYATGGCPARRSAAEARACPL